MTIKKLYLHNITDIVYYRYKIPHIVRWKNTYCKNSSLFADFLKYCLLNGGSQRRVLSTYHSEKTKLINYLVRHGSLTIV